MVRKDVGMQYQNHHHGPVARPRPRGTYKYSVCFKYANLNVSNSFDDEHLDFRSIMDRAGRMAASATKVGSVPICIFVKGGNVTRRQISTATDLDEFLQELGQPMVGEDQDLAFEVRVDKENPKLKQFSEFHFNDEDLDDDDSISDNDDDCRTIRTDPPVGQQKFSTHTIDYEYMKPVTVSGDIIHSKAAVSKTQRTDKLSSGNTGSDNGTVLGGLDHEQGSLNSHFQRSGMPSDEEDVSTLTNAKRAAARNADETPLQNASVASERDARRAEITRQAPPPPAAKPCRTREDSFGEEGSDISPKEQTMSSSEPSLHRKESVRLVDFLTDESSTAKLSRVLMDPEMRPVLDEVSKALVDIFVRHSQTVLKSLGTVLREAPELASAFEASFGDVIRQSAELYESSQPPPPPPPVVDTPSPPSIPRSSRAQAAFSNNSSSERARVAEYGSMPNSPEKDTLRSSELPEKTSLLSSQDARARNMLRSVTLVSGPTHLSSDFGEFPHLVELVLRCSGVLGWPRDTMLKKTSGDLKIEPVRVGEARDGEKKEIELVIYRPELDKVDSYARLQLFSESIPEKFFGQPLEIHITDSDVHLSQPSDNVQTQQRGKGYFDAVDKSRQSSINDSPLTVSSYSEFVCGIPPTTQATRQAVEDVLSDSKMKQQHVDYPEESRYMYQYTDLEYQPRGNYQLGQESSKYRDNYSYGAVIDVEESQPQYPQIPTTNVHRGNPHYLQQDTEITTVMNRLQKECREAKNLDPSILIDIIMSCNGDFDRCIEFIESMDLS